MKLTMIGAPISRFGFGAHFDPIIPYVPNLSAGEELTAISRPNNPSALISLPTKLTWGWRN